MKNAVLITGASSGIGFATAKLFSEKNYFVYLAARSADKLESLALKCHAGASILKIDLSKPDSIKKYTEHVLERPDTKLTTIVNNAGIFQTNSFTSGTATWREQFEVNLFGCIDLTNQLIPLLLKNAPANIVNVSSTLGLKPTAQTSAYSASKAAMINWTQSLAQELGPKNIRVNCVCPGIVDTPIQSFHHLPAEQKKQTLEKMGPLQPLGRIGTAEEIARSIYFLASNDSSWTTGAVLSVDGGINLT